MIGRDGERERLSTFMAAAEGQALVLRGEAGVGKSALLDHVAQPAGQAGHEVIRAAGAEAESGLPFAGLHQFLHPLVPPSPASLRRGLGPGAPARCSTPFSGGAPESRRRSCRSSPSWTCCPWPTRRSRCCRFSTTASGWTPPASR
ncbi:AAA family ATPase [Streptomyces antimycoticus]|uniref:AAA family ATPase n=1 Tax=Streptomyces antimycoticus TaxID=68175 RepID=UPI00381E3A39